MCVYVCACACVHTCVCVSVRVCAHMCECEHVCEYIFAYLAMHIWFVGRHLKTSLAIYMTG